MLLANDDAVQHGNLTPLLRLESRERGRVVHRELRRYPPDLVAAYVRRSWRQERRIAIKELHVPVLVLGDLRSSGAGAPGGGHVI